MQHLTPQCISTRHTWPTNLQTPSPATVYAVTIALRDAFRTPVSRSPIWPAMVFRAWAAVGWQMQIPYCSMRQSSSSRHSEMASRYKLELHSHCYNISWERCHISKSRMCDTLLKEAKMTKSLKKIQLQNG